jgi:transposase, IS5 family
MRPRERRETGEQDLFRSRLDQIIDLRHPLVKLAREVDWGFLERTFGAAYTDGPGQPPLPTRLMAGLIILKYTHDLSDEALCERWVENPYYQYFCGEEFFQHELVLDRSSLSNWRKRMGEEKVRALLQESLAVATKTGAVKPSQLCEVIVDTTVQPKNVMFPTDARLLNRAREILVRMAKAQGVKIRQSYARVGKLALIKHQRYAHAKQFKRANRALKKLKTYLGRVIRDIARKIEGDAWLEEMVFGPVLSLARRVRDQRAHQRGPKVYSLHNPGGVHPPPRTAAADSGPRRDRDRQTGAPRRAKARDSGKCSLDDRAPARRQTGEWRAGCRYRRACRRHGRS